MMLLPIILIILNIFDIFYLMTILKYTQIKLSKEANQINLLIVD